MQISDFSGLAFRRFSGKGEPGIILFPGCFVFRLALWQTVPKGCRPSKALPFRRCRFWTVRFADYLRQM